MALEHDRIRLLKIIEDYQTRILDLEVAQTNSVKERNDNQAERKKLQKSITSEARKLLSVNKQITDMTKSYLGHQIELEDRIKNISDSQQFIRNIEKQRIDNYNTIDTKLTGNLEKFNHLADLNIQMAGLSSDDISKMQLLNIEYIEIEASLDRRGKGLSAQLEILQEQNTVARQYASLSQTQKDVMEGQRQVLDGIKKTIIGTIETAATLYGNVQGAFGGIVTLAGMLEHNISDVNKTFGYTLLDMNSAAKSAGFLNLFFEDAAGTARELANQFGSVEGASFKTQMNVGLISSTMGISNMEAASLVSSFARMNGGSADIATDMIQTTKEFAKQNNVIPADVLSDLAGSAAEFAKYANDGGKNLIKAAVGARQLGVSLGTVTGIADNLLDFESSITSELELGAMLGRSINFNKARQLAYDGEIEKAAQETLRQLGGINSFNQMDVFAKQESAKAIGVSVDELQKMLNNQDKVVTQGELIQERFSAIGSTIDAGLNKYLGASLKGLGGMITASAQVGGNFAQMGFSLKGIGKKIASLLPSMGGLSKKVGGFLGGGASTVSEQAKPTTSSLPGKGIMDGMSKINMGEVLKGAAAMVIVSAAVFVFGKAVQEFMKVSWESVGMAVVSMLALVGAVALLGVIMSSGVGTVAILQGAAAMIIVAGAMYILGTAIQEMAIGFSAMGKISDVIGGLIGMIGGIGLISAAFMGLAGSLMFLGTAGLVALPGLLAMSTIGSGLGVVGDVIGIGKSSENKGGVSDGSLSDYQTQMLQKMDQLIRATSSNRDVYIDREKVTNIVMKTSERKTENVFGLGVA